MVNSFLSRYPSFSLWSSSGENSPRVMSASLVVSGLMPVVARLALGTFLLPYTAYLPSKNGLVNSILVGNPWLWATLVCLGVYRSRSRSVQETDLLSLWLLATAWWLLVTRWFMGPSLTDRTFIATGGECQEYAGLSMPTTRSQCRISGGEWVGGHDISGQAFTVTHATMLIYNMHRTCQPASWGRIAAMGPWCWIMFMTVVHPHPLLETVTACIVAASVWST
ncbi:unnamed protein product [Tuber aestivum]|uniref:Uncharacterized protein n=1 Tax=Tuber aestivum TaxID=59557 RepID=A0A292PJ65_9PEZI|nr:unnamed protein product [Tuber aestivum]